MAATATKGALDIAEVITINVVKFAQPELLPLIRPIFSVAKGTVGFADGICAVLEKQNQPDELQQIQTAIETLTSQMTKRVDDVEQILTLNQPYENIVKRVKCYQDNSIDELPPNFCNDLSADLEALKKNITGKNQVIAEHTSWISYLCKCCQDKSSC